MCKLKVVLIIFLYSASFNIWGQNLIPNPSFEEYSELPTEFAQWSYCHDWISPEGAQIPGIYYGTPDYYHAQAFGPMNLPNSSNAQVYPLSGEAVVGLVSQFGTGAGANYREYLSCQLTSSLEIGAYYKVSFWITNGHDLIVFNETSNGMGVNLSTNQIYQPANDPIQLSPHFEITDQLWSTEWVEYSFYIYADSAYQFLTVGNFNDDNDITTTQVQSQGSAGTYYYLDNFELTGVEEKTVTICRGKAVELEAPTSSSYSWYSKGNANDVLSSESALLVSPDSTKTYFFISDEVVLEYRVVVEECVELIMPNVFTPNNDLTNDVLSPVSMKNIASVNLKVYNRWGVQVYSGDISQQGWDGLSEGSKCTDGIYFWVADYVGVFGGQYSSKGLVHLISGEG